MNEEISQVSNDKEREFAFPDPNSLSVGRRYFSLAEFVVGSAIAIGHNVYHVVPNEVPILFVLGLISIRLRDGGWAAMGLHPPVSWRRVVLFALLVAA